MKLIGETKGRPEGDRVPINISEKTRTRLNRFLYLPEMRGVGFSEFINRALDAAEAELNESKSEMADTADRIPDWEFIGPHPQTMLAENRELRDRLARAEAAEADNARLRDALEACSRSGRGADVIARRALAGVGDEKPDDHDRLVSEPSVLSPEEAQRFREATAFTGDPDDKSLWQDRGK